MNYIYDTYLNFNKNLYDFYEWSGNDEITHIRKIPTFKISTTCFFNLKNNIIKIDKNFLAKISYKSEEFKENKIDKIKYTAMFSDGKDIIAIKFNKLGINYMKSSLLIDEEEDIINIIKNQQEINPQLKIIKAQKTPQFKTRFEKENQKFITHELNKIYKNNDIEKINYICLECFGKEEKNMKKAIAKIKKEITKENDNFYKIFKIFKMINQNN